MTSRRSLQLDPLAVFLPGRRFALALLLFLGCLSVLLVPPDVLGGVFFHSVTVTTVQVCSHSITVPRPSDVLPGDLLLAYIVVSPTYRRDITGPAGWTELVSVVDDPNMPTWLFYRLVDTVEPATYTWELPAWMCFTGAALSVYRGVDPIAPIDTFDGQENPPSNLQPVPEITTTIDGAMLVAYYALDWPGTTWTAPDGMSERFEASTGDASFGGADAIQELAGPTGTSVATSFPWSTSGTGLIVALRPAFDPAPPVNGAPKVLITTPAAGTTVPRGSYLTIAATAVDDTGVARIEFYVNDRLVCADIGAPSTCQWQVPRPPRRAYRLVAVAYDDAGNVGVSPVVTIMSSSSTEK